MGDKENAKEKRKWKKKKVGVQSVSEHGYGSQW